MTSKFVFKEKLKMYSHLKSIRNRLWTEDGKSKVSVMVGAGFSLNAEKLKDSFESMSLWSNLKSKISEGLNNEKINDLDVLELGELYEDEYGRANLDELLKQAIPDQNYEPGDLHKSLLRLPWADVYTTNYDTLLERTLPDVYERSYQVIYDSSDISSSSSPRIVKLHGSFPSKRPFIFTKKDYALYEKEFAPFVNMVQQSIMETTLVLIGFSGDDPNFEKWTNWVHDNLGNHMPKIYMLACGEQEKEVELRKKGITLIDFQEVYKEHQSSEVYKLMFKDIFSFLSYEEKREKKEWPHTPYYRDYSSIEDIITTLIGNRIEYPGWLITPDIIKKSNTENIQWIRNYILHKLNEEKSLFNQIKVIKELAWLYEKFLIPIDMELYNTMKEIVNKSFKDINSVENLNDLGTIVLRLLKEARLDFDEENFSHNIKLLEQLPLDDEQRNLLFFEKILFKLANYKFSDVSSMINEWTISKKDLEWCIKKANILLRIGEVNTAIELLEECLDRVRKLLTIKSTDYHLLSIEGIILVKLVQLSENDEFSFKNSRNRLSFLESRLSNPLKELDFMYSRIRPYQRKADSFIRKGFDPNRITKTSNFSSKIETELVDSFCLLMISEELGIHIGSGSSRKVINNAINNLEYLYPFYSWIKYLQVGDLKELDNFFSRKVIFKAKNSKLSVFFNIIMNGIENKKNTNTQLLLEILSRLYSVLSKEEKRKIDNLVLNLFVDREFYSKHGFIIKKVFSPLFKRIIFDKNVQEKAAFFGEILKLPIIGDPNGVLKDITLDEYNFFEPAIEFYFETDNISRITIDTTNVETIKLINILNYEKSLTRDAALARLIRLFETGNLDKEEIFKIRESIKHIIVKEQSKPSYYFLESYLVKLTNDTEIQENYAKSRIEKNIPESHINNITSIGDNLNNLLRDLKNIFPNFVKNNKVDYAFITDEMYKTWLKRFFKWWESQEKWLLSSNNNGFFGENDDLLSMVIFLKNSFLANIPLECLSNNDRAILKQIYNKLSNSKPEISILLIPVLLRVKVLQQDETQVLLENMLTTDLEISKSVISSIYDLIIISKNNEIDLNLSELKIELLNLYKYRKENTLLEVTKSLKFICQYAPDAFSKNEYETIGNTLKFIIKDINNGYYEDSFISDQEFELLSESTGLAGYIYKNNSFAYPIDLDPWKKISIKSQLPEVRKYAPLFQ